MRSRPVLRTPLASFDMHEERLQAQRGSLRSAISRAVEDESRAVDHLLERVRSLSPQRTLERGYAILSDGTDTITSVHQVDQGDDLMAYVHDGSIILEVREATPHAHQQSDHPGGPR